MIRVRWELEEAVALMDLYFRYGATLSVPNDELLKLSQIYRNRQVDRGKEGEWADSQYWFFVPWDDGSFSAVDRGL